MNEEQYVYEEIVMAEVPPGDILQTSFLEKVIVAILVGFVFFMPVFFFPVNGIFSGFGKNILLAAVVISTFTLILILWIKEGRVVLPKSKVFTALFILIAAFIFSSFLSGVFTGSFFGSGTEITTSLEVLLLGILTFLFAVFFRNQKRISLAISVLFVSSFFVFLFQIVHLIFPLLSVAGMSSDKTYNLIGSWGDFGIFSGMVAILLLISLEKLNKRNSFKRGGMYVLLAVALFFYGLASYSGSWIILGVVALALSIFFFFEHISTDMSGNISVAQKWLMTPSFVVAAISLVFVFSGPAINDHLFKVIDIPQVQDVRPSLSGTEQVFLGLYKEDKKQTIFGVGPNRFYVPWQKYRPQDINYTPWWSVNFNEGVGTIPTSLITVGIVGLLAWIGFILLFIFGGLRALRSRYREMSTFEQSLSLSSFVGALYCWTSAIFGTVGVVPFTSAFVFTGLFLGLLSSFGSWQVKEYSYLREPQKGFTIVVILLCLLGSSIALGYQISQRTRAFFAYHQAVDSATAGKIEAAEAEFVKALSIAPNDSYYRSYSALNSYKAQQLVSRTDLSPDDLRSQFGLSFKASIESAQKAIAFDGENYLNWISLGNAYAMIVPFGIEKISDDAYSQAVDVYEKAAQRSPLNPQIPYILTTLAVSHNKPDEAREYAKRALDLKNDNPDALILLSQIEDNSGRPKDALALMEGAPAAEFSNPQVLFQLGYLRYKTGNYQAAVSALEKAVKAIPDYANAKYFLGLSYFENADKEKALKEFSDIKRLNPGRADITQIIKNIQNGYAPIGTPSKKENSDGSKNSTTTTKNKI